MRPEINHLLERIIRSEFDNSDSSHTCLECIELAESLKMDALFINEMKSDYTEYFGGRDVFDRADEKYQQFKENQ